GGGGGGGGAAGVEVRGGGAGGGAGGADPLGGAAAGRHALDARRGSHGEHLGGAVVHRPPLSDRLHRGELGQVDADVGDPVGRHGLVPSRAVGSGRRRGGSYHAGRRLRR